MNLIWFLMASLNLAKCSSGRLKMKVFYYKIKHLKLAYYVFGAIVLDSITMNGATSACRFLKVGSSYKLVITVVKPLKNYL